MSESIFACPKCHIFAGVGPGLSSQITDSISERTCKPLDTNLFHTSTFRNSLILRSSEELLEEPTRANPVGANPLGTDARFFYGADTLEQIAAWTAPYLDLAKLQAAPQQCRPKRDRNFDRRFDIDSI